MKSKSVGLMLVLVLAMLSACSLMGPAETPTADFVGTDFAFTGPASVTEGWVTVNFQNDGAEPHHLQFMRLNDGATLEQFTGALAANDIPGALGMVASMPGGVGVVPPGTSGEVVVELSPGTYVVICFVESESDHLPHLAKGMINQITVTAVEGNATAVPAPEAAATVTLSDFKVEMPDTLPAGETTVQITNNGPEDHEWNLLRLADGATFDDFTAFMAGGVDGPPPFAPAGGMQGLSPATTGYAVVNLAPGNYVALCFIPSPAAGDAPHFTLGMVKPFTVGDAAASSN